ncbi:hypothetical protein RRG08_025964 [Elysia crispata]|uniref:Uncharacterized protein n=1 Tax=Elysia crispata TaxID=231223 RepID=A0AAE1DG92_9GAST|nr:hypothetical protein RRG08_025964 [Elysia crispata]
MGVWYVSRVDPLRPTGVTGMAQLSREKTHSSPSWVCANRSYKHGTAVTREDPLVLIMGVWYVNRVDPLRPTGVTGMAQLSREKTHSSPSWVCGVNRVDPLQPTEATGMAQMSREKTHSSSSWVCGMLIGLTRSGQQELQAWHSCHARRPTRPHHGSYRHGTAVTREDPLVPMMGVWYVNRVDPFRPTGATGIAQLSREKTHSSP